MRLTALPYRTIARYVAKTFLLEDLKLTAFEKKVLKATLEIPLGQTRSYAWVAKATGSPGAVRAVGQALKKNPYPLLIPCHRVIGSHRSLGGYAGGIKLKKALLELEQKIVADFQKEFFRRHLKKPF